ncbi:cytosolic protein [Sphingomonas sp. LH128]|uniref:Cytosolic protein n=1 Tax=Novosphingobium resinovorum TaxID=158500 RepID=A0A031JNN1_9SPHN|nr:MULTISPECIES: kinase [Sphingomonadaceae]EJU11491.1 cytosolic protein [Sphingomonas sp. LH128]EZP74756.1 Cytosolic protein [Novosphingobium resinovorum]
MTPSAERVAGAARRWLEAPRHGPLILGLCGSQGSGKSTLAEALKSALEAEGRRVAVLSLDDLYLGRSARAQLARTVHPLFATRGVPGTHDTARGVALIDAIRAGEPVTLPRFDKARDEPAPQGDGVPADLDLLIFEGWCVGARPQDAGALAVPVNALELEEDPQGTWRGHVNTALAGPYADLFARIDRLVLLAAPGFEVVRGWRGQQEDALRAREAEGTQVMDEAALDRFVQHYERLTRDILTEMPGRADLVLCLAADRSLVSAFQAERITACTAPARRRGAVASGPA